MKPTINIISMLLAFISFLPAGAQAFWGSDEPGRSGLNLDSGYDANTVTTLTGRIVSVQSGDEHRNVQLELESDGGRVVAVLGPAHYWLENGIALKAGDEVAVRGSKAQGKDGVVYLLVQKLTDTTSNIAVRLRNEAGRPAWAGAGRGNVSGQMNNRPAQKRQQSPGRMGGGRMGR
ncbi:MAG: hypothetical protein A2511_15565 [Deltaproteobacteria bacterium RIFOXYD12_FULL_50_9]|nr:MAG: hypothetical protein A2511_15565 [Deltaproteobacteria bacterium RIFOXYD12_FULL_50_9]